MSYILSRGDAYLGNVFKSVIKFSVCIGILTTNFDETGVF